MHAKNNFILIVFISTIFCVPANLFAQKKKKSGGWKNLLNGATADSTDNNPSGIRYEDYVYKPNIKTVQLRDESFELSQPILNLGSEEKLKLSFDDMDANVKTYTYTVIHCNADWQPSDLMPAEYIDGFIETSITDYSYSFNTLIHFTHFNAVFPNASMHITKSGNYILKVYQDSDPSNIVVTRRFMVYQNKVMVQAKVGAASIVSDRNYKQEIDFTINHNGYPIANPYNDLNVVITQNNHWDNAKTTLKPLFVKDNELVYDFEDGNVFTGGNEFRYFDLKSVRYHSEKIYDIKTDSAGYQIFLYNDEKRTIKRHYSSPDMNGNYLVKVQEGRNSETEADYCYVHFFLPSDEAYTDGYLYIFGAFNAWQCNQENLMRYDSTRFGYVGTLLLKQGYYNYEYVFVKKGEPVPDETLIEGMHFETENEYTIYVYNREQGTFYDQLIAVKRVNSMKDN